MAYLARVTYTGNGNTTGYALPFSYIATSHIYAWLDNVVTTAFTVSGATLTFTSAPANGVVILIKRVTPTDARLVDFTDGSVLTESDLDQSADQNFYIAQETSDTAQTHLGLDNSDRWDADSKRIINVANPTDNQDGVTKYYLENTWLSSSDKTNLTTVAGISANITTVAGISSDVTTVANDATDIGAVAGKATEIGRLGTADAVADLAILGTTDVVADMNTLATADVVADMNTLGTADVVADMNTLGTADVVADMNTLGTADVVADMNTLATSANVTNMATLGASGVVANIATVAGQITPTNNINTVATNITGINSFADRYRVGSSDPSTSLDAGDLNFNTSSNDLKYYDGSSWNVIANQDINVKVSANDTSSGVLSSKITATGSTGVSLTETNDGSNETLNVTLASVPNASLSNYQITINGSAVDLGGSITVGETKPTATGCTPSTITNDATNVVIAGTNFTSIPQVWALNTSTGIWYLANSVSYTSATSITANFTLSVDASYKIRVENPDGNAALSSTNILTVSDEPTWSTASGSLGTVAGDFSGTVATVAATSDSAITYSEVTTGGNVLTNASQANCSLASSTGVITTSDFGGSSTTATTYNFTIRATDAESQTTDRTFSLTSSYGATGGGQFN